MDLATTKNCEFAFVSHEYLDPAGRSEPDVPCTALHFRENGLLFQKLVELHAYVNSRVL